MRRRSFVSISAFIAMIAIAGSGAGAQEDAKASSSSLVIDAGMDVFLGAFQWKPGFLSDALKPGFAFDSDFFDASAKFSGLNDGAYDAFNSYTLGHYFLIDEAKAGLSYRGLSLSGGKGPASDIADSPYSVFISSESIPAVFLDLAWDSPIFSYRSRWISLNQDSALDYEGTEGGMPVLDRGMNFKTYALNLGALRIGFEDCVVYLDKVFDAEYFLSPAPMFIAEMVSTSPGRPDMVEGNTNSLMGFFADYRKPDWDVYGQFLIDDINAKFLAPVLGWAIPSLYDIDNLNKFAWSLGGRWRSPYGAFSFHHGGATAYAFESTYTSAHFPGGILPGGLLAYSVLPYEYVYYPVTEFARGDGSRSAIPYVDNYIGYKYGENNIAFQFGYANSAFKEKPFGFGYSACLEYVISGTKSPSNPWAEDDTWVGITEASYRLLDEAVLEHRLTLSAAAAKAWKGWTFSIGAELGYAWNRLALVETNPGEAKIWKPQAGIGQSIYGFTLGASYRWNIRERAAGR
jgi:hypothetical protein